MLQNCFERNSKSFLAAQWDYKSSKQAVRLEIICSLASSSPMTALPASDSSLHLWHSQTALLEYWGSGENTQVRHTQDMALRMEMNIKFSSILYEIPL